MYFYLRRIALNKNTITGSKHQKSIDAPFVFTILYVWKVEELFMKSWLLQALYAKGYIKIHPLCTRTESTHKGFSFIYRNPDLRFWRWINYRARKDKESVINNCQTFTFGTKTTKDRVLLTAHLRTIPTKDFWKKKKFEIQIYALWINLVFKEQFEVFVHYLAHS